MTPSLHSRDIHFLDQPNRAPKAAPSVVKINFSEGNEPAPVRTWVDSDSGKNSDPNKPAKLGRPKKTP